MNIPSSVTRALIDKYSEIEDSDEQRRRNLNVSNWIKYSTRNEINEIIENQELDLYEKVMLYLY